MFKLQSPIQKAVRDPKKVSKFFEDFKLVPYYGAGAQTSHAYLQLFTDLNKLSPSASACKSDLSLYAFDGDLDVVIRTEPGLADEAKKISKSEKAAYIEAIKSIGLNFSTVRSITKDSQNNYWDTGNKYVHCKIIRINNVDKVVLTVIDPLHFMYLWTEPDEPRTCIISDIWDANKWQEKRPKMCRVFPNWTEGTERGVSETVFHFQTGIGESDWYSEPKDLASMYWKFSEFSMGNLYSKISSTEVVSKGILVTEAQASEENEKDSVDIRRRNFEEKVKTIRAVTTNEGDQGKSSSVAVLEVPYAGPDRTPMKPAWLPLELNRDTQNHSFVVTEASAKIYAGLNWSPELSGYTRSAGGIGSEILINLFKIKNQTSVKKLQQQGTEELDVIFSAIWTKLGKENLNQYSIVFPDNIAQLIKSLRDNGTRDTVERV